MRRNVPQAGPASPPPAQPPRGDAAPSARNGTPEPALASPPPVEGGGARPAGVPQRTPRPEPDFSTLPPGIAASLARLAGIAVAPEPQPAEPQREKEREPEKT